MKKIYNNQIKAGNEIYQRLINLCRNDPALLPVLLCAQMQSGKTLSVVWALYKLIQKLGGSEKCNTLWLGGPSDCKLKGQTLDAIKELYEDINGIPYDFSIVENSLIEKSVYHGPSIKKSSKKDKEKILSSLQRAKERGKTNIVVLDEAHIGIGVNQSIPKFLEDNLSLPGIGKALEDCIFIIITATPGPYINHRDIFNIVYVQPGENYVSLKKLYDDGRLHQTFSVESKDSKRQWIDDVFLPFYEKKPSYGITRINGNNDHLLHLLSSLQSSYDFIIKHYNYRSNNIEDLARDLNERPEKHTICVITDSYLQGSTVNKTYIGYWFDRFSKSATAANTLQSSGRNCGYNCGDNPYPIWTNIKHILEGISFYDSAEKSDLEGMTSNNMSGPNFQESSEKAEIDILVFSSKEELMRHPFVKSKIHSKTIRSVSKQNENNMADDILRKNGRNMPQGHEAQIIRCDGPNIKFNQSYIDLKSTHPDYDQKFLFAFKTGNVKRNFNDKTFLGKK